MVTSNDQAFKRQTEFIRLAYPVKWMDDDEKNNVVNIEEWEG